jgi:hypothetical protein
MAGAGTGQQQPNVFGAAAQGMGQAGMTAGMETMYRPQNINVGMANTAMSRYAPQVMANQVGYDPVASTNVSAERINPANVASTNVMANNVNAGQIAGTDFSAYTNPYESQVVGQSISDLDRARQMQERQLNAQATQAGAFGGSRQALMQSELGRNYLDQAARTASGLRQAGFQNAQQLAGQDIASRMQADLANQGANLQASQLNQSAAMQAALANQQAGLTAGSQNQQAALQAALANQSTGMQAGLANQGAGIQTGLANQGANLQAGSLNANLAQQANMSNQAARNQMSQFNIGNQLQAALANQQAGLSGSQNRLSAAGQLGQLSNLGFGQGMALQDQAMQQGALTQGINQMLIDATKNQFAGYQDAPGRSLGYMTAALGATPTPTTTTASRQPGLFDYLTMAASMGRPIR